MTKYDLLRAPKQSLFLFCLISDYLYTVIAITQTFMLCLENVSCVMVIDLTLNYKQTTLKL